jgi:hypothetical protein
MAAATEPERFQRSAVGAKDVTPARLDRETVLVFLRCHPEPIRALRGWREGSASAVAVAFVSQARRPGPERGRRERS